MGSTAAFLGDVLKMKYEHEFRSERKGERERERERDGDLKNGEETGKKKRKVFRIKLWRF